MTSEAFFSVSTELITADCPAWYDLYINSSGVDARQHFVRVFQKGQFLTVQDVQELKSKYHQLYVSESQRSLYFESITKAPKFSQIEKTQIIKQAAIQHLDHLFNHSGPLTTEVLNDTIRGCHDTVTAIVDVVQNDSIESLQKHISQLSFHDSYTYDHSINVSMYCVAILKALIPSSENSELITAGLGGLLHDLGKVNVPTHLLNKAGKLTDEEFNEIKRHTDYGMALLNENGIEMPKGVPLTTVRAVVYEHHENYNGTGYPRSLTAENIHIFARICAIADFFDAITTKRSYHEAMPIDDALSLMSKTSGKKLDPKLFAEFVKYVRNLSNEQLQKFPAELPEGFDPCQPHDKLPLLTPKVVGNAPVVNPQKKFDKSQFSARPQTSKIIKGSK